MTAVNADSINQMIVSISRLPRVWKLFNRSPHVIWLIMLNINFNNAIGISRVFYFFDQTLVVRVNLKQLGHRKIFTHWNTISLILIQRKGLCLLLSALEKLKHFRTKKKLRTNIWFKLFILASQLELICKYKSNGILWQMSLCTWFPITMQIN